MSNELDFPLVITNIDNAPEVLRCFCGRQAIEVREDQYGRYAPCREHAEEDDLLIAAEHGASNRGAA